MEYQYSLPPMPPDRHEGIDLNLDQTMPPDQKGTVAFDINQTMPPDQHKPLSIDTGQSMPPDQKTGQTIEPLPNMSPDNTEQARPVAAEPPSIPTKSQRIRLLMRGLKADFEPKEFLSKAAALDAVNCTVSADGNGLRMPIGGRTITHDCLEELGDDEFLTYVLKVDLSLLGNTTGVVFAAFDSDHNCKLLQPFFASEQYRSPSPLPDVQPPSLVVTSPLPGDALYGNEDQTITWTTVGTAPPGSTNVELLLYLKNTTTDAWELENTVLTDGVIVASTDRATASYAWGAPISNGYVAGTYKIRIRATGNPSWYAESGEFTITPSSITITAPSSDTSIESPVSGTTTYQIQWAAVGTTGATVQIDLYKGGVFNRAIVAAGEANDGAYDWTVPSGISADSDYTIKITPGGAGAIAAVDSEEFTITLTAPTPTILSVTQPYAGASFHALNSIFIRWTTQGNVGTVTVELLKGSSVIETIVMGVSQDYYSYSIPATEPGAPPDDNAWSGTRIYTIRVSSETLATPTSATSGSFTINPPYILSTLFNSPTSIESGASIPITWNSFGNVAATVKIELIDKNGDATTIVSSTANDGYYLWTVDSSGLEGSEYRIRISDTDDTSVFCDSDSPLTIHGAMREYAFFCVWNRQENPNGAVNGLPGGQHEIWRADLSKGPNSTPVLFVAGDTNYGGAYGTNYSTVREMITDKDGNLLVLWMDAEVLAGAGGETYGLPGKRDGRTARLKKYDAETGEEIWEYDASAYLVSAYAPDTVETLEHGAIAVNDSGTVFLALHGWIDSGSVERYLFAFRINGVTGALVEFADEITRTAGVAISITEDIGLCAVYGAAWSPDGNFWVVCDHKRVDNGAAPYDATEFVGVLFRFADDDLTDVTSYQPQPELSEYCMYLGIQYHHPGYLICPVFYLYDEGGANEERRLGAMFLNLNGKITAVDGYGYNDVNDPVFGTSCHPGGLVGFERMGQRFDIFDVIRQTKALSGGSGRVDRTWFSDGKNLWLVDFDRKTVKPRIIDAGGTAGQGDENTYNCHALTRRSNGDLVYLSYEYIDLAGGGTDLRVRIRVARPGSGTVRFDVVSDHESSNEVTLPYINQPYQWNVGIGTRGGDDDFPWCPFAIACQREKE